jgi:large subunit ribosomal protein L44e
MKIPKQVMRYCPNCKKHTKHNVAQAKRKAPNSAHPLSKSAKSRTGFGKGTGNLGKLGSKPPISKWKSTGKKTTKKTDLRYKCSVCKKTHMQSKGKRVKKVELI